MGDAPSPHFEAICAAVIRDSEPFQANESSMRKSPKGFAGAREQIRNCLAVRRVVPQGLERTELIWTCFGYETDDELLTELRLRQANLIGPSGFISMEDGAATGFVQRGIRGAGDEESVVEMGGSGTSSEESRVSEAAVRGFWKAYRQYMNM